MAKYKLEKDGVYDTETNRHIPNSDSNTYWKEYQAWLSNGNTPDPMDVIDPWVAGRQLRDGFLNASDWTQLPDSQLTPAKKAAWATYRQELRDLPVTYPDYNDVVWPLKPAS